MRYRTFGIVIILLTSFIGTTHAAVGDMGEPFSLSLGEQTFPIDGASLDEYFRFYGDTDKLYRFTVSGPITFDATVHTNDTSSDQLLYLDSVSGLPGEFAHFGYSNYTIQIETFGYSGTLSITITEEPIPAGSTPDDALSASLGNNTGSITYEGEMRYYKLPTSIGQWYHLHLQFDEEALRLEENSTGFFTGSTGYSDEVRRSFEATQSFSYISIEAMSDPTDYVLTISEMTTPLHYSEQLSKDAVLGQNTGEVYAEGMDYYFNLSTTVGQWYELSMEEHAGTDFDLYYELNSGYEGSFIPIDPHVTAFEADLDATYIKITSESGIGSFNLDISEIAPVQYHSEEDAKPAVLGQNSGEVKYYGKSYFFNLTTTPGNWYVLEGASQPGTIMYLAYQSTVSIGWDNNLDAAFRATSDSTIIRVYFESEFGPFDLNISEYAVPHGSIETAKQYTLGQNTGTTPHNQVPFYFNFTTTASQWYRINISMVDSGSQNDYEVRDITGIDYTPTFYGNEPLSYFQGDGGEITVKIKSYGEIGDFIATLEEVAPASYYDFSTARMVNLGITDSNSGYYDLSQYFMFNANPDSHYQVEVLGVPSWTTTTFSAYYGNQNYLEESVANFYSSIVTGASSYYFKVSMFEEDVDYQLRIREIDYPTLLQFNQLESGDTAKWDFETYVHESFSEIISSYGLNHGNGTFTMTNDIDQPTIERQKPYWENTLAGVDFYSISSSGIDIVPFYFTDLILPTDIMGQDAIAVADYLTHFGLFGGQINVTETDSQYIVEADDSFLMPIDTVMTFSKTTGVLESEIMSISYQGKVYFSQEVTLVSTSVSPISGGGDSSGGGSSGGGDDDSSDGSSSDPTNSTTPDNPPDTSDDVGLLSWSTLYFLTGLIILPLIRRNNLV